MLSTGGVLPLLLAAGTDLAVPLTEEEVRERARQAWSEAENRVGPPPRIEDYEDYTQDDWESEQGSQCEYENDCSDYYYARKAWRMRVVSEVDVDRLPLRERFSVLTTRQSEAWQELMANQLGTHPDSIGRYIGAGRGVIRNELDRYSRSPGRPERCREAEGFEAGIRQSRDTGRYLIAHGELVKVFAAHGDVGNQWWRGGARACVEYDGGTERARDRECCIRGFVLGQQQLLSFLKTPPERLDFRARMALIPCRHDLTRGAMAGHIACYDCKTIVGTFDFNVTNVGCFSLGFTEAMRACNHGVQTYLERAASAVSDDDLSEVPQADVCEEGATGDSCREEHGVSEAVDAEGAQ